MAKSTHSPSNKRVTHKYSAAQITPRFYSNLGIGGKLNLGFGILVGFTLLIIAFNLIAGQAVTENINKVENSRVPASLASATAQANLLKMMTNMRGYLVLGNPRNIQDYKHAKQDFEANLAELETLSVNWTNPQSVQHLNELKTIFEEWSALPEPMFALHDNPRENQPALRIARLEVQPLNETILNQIDDMIKIQEQRDSSDENIILLKNMVNFRATFNAMITGLRAYATTHDLTSKFTYATNLAENQTAWNNLLTQKPALNNSQQILLNNIALAREQLLNLPAQIFENAESERAYEDLYLFKTEAVPRAEHMLQLLDEMIIAQQTLLQADLNKGRQGLTNVQWLTFAISLLALLWGIGMALVVRKNIALPIHRLTNTAEQIAKGDLTARAPIASGDEIGRLAVTFNTMTTQLSETIINLEQTHNQLEQRVAERTTELSKANISLQKQIVERKRVEEALAKERNILRTLIDNLPDYIFVKDTRSHFIAANTATARFMGQTSPKALIGKSDFDFYPKQEAAEYYTEEQVIFESGQPIINKDESRTNKSGDTIWVSITKTPLRNTNNRITGLVGIGRDITNQKKNEQERDQFIAELEAKNAELERFTYSVSHDLKSPLVTIRGFLGLLEQDALAGDIERTKGDIKHIRTATEKMKQLLDELLELSRIGRLINPPQVVSLKELVDEAIVIVTGQIVSRNVEVTILPNLPVVSVDKPRLVEVLQNLIDNAIKYMNNQPHPRIEIGAKQKNQQIICYVKDNGGGIDVQYHEKIFGLFERLDHNIEGTGVGLALAKRIIDVHGGQIWVESEGAGHGSTFFFTLPVAKALPDIKQE